MKPVIHSLTVTLLATVFLFTSCSDNNETPVPKPSIDSFTPTHGLVGASVIITGKNFSTTPAENVLKFNGVTATVTNATTTQLTTTIPVGAATGKLSLTVSGTTVASATEFVVDLPVVLKPTIISFTPTHGLVGATITLAGTNFSTTPAENVLKFNGVAATVTNATTTQLTTTVPVGATTGKLSLTVAGNMVESTTDFTVTPLPSMDSFTPTHGLVGAIVTITGTNFSTTAAENVLKFNGVTATVTHATATQLTTTVPVGATTGKLSLTVSGSTIESTANFTVDLLVSCLLTKFTVVGSDHADADLNTTGSMTFEYNDKGELIKSTDTDGYETVTTYTYVNGFVTEVKSVDIYETVVEKWSYNASNLVSHIDGTIEDEVDTYTYTKDFVYDGAKKLISIKRLTDANANYLMTFTYTGNNVTSYVAEDIDLGEEFENGTYADFDTKKNPFLLLAKAIGNQTFFISEVTSADVLSANNAKTVNENGRGGESTGVYEYDINDNVKKQTVTRKEGGKYVVTFEYNCN